MNSQIDEQRVLGILMSFPNLCSTVKSEWFRSSINRRIFLAIRDTGSTEIHDLVDHLRASDDGAKYMLGLCELGYASDNLHAFVGSMRARCENVAFAGSLAKLVASQRGGGKLFANIWKGESNEKSKVRT